MWDEFKVVKWAYGTILKLNAFEYVYEWQGEAAKGTHAQEGLGFIMNARQSLLELMANSFDVSDLGLERECYWNAGIRLQKCYQIA